MKGSPWHRFAALLAILLLTTAISALPPEQDKDTTIPGYPGSYCADYCSATNCGCGAPPPGYYLASYSCTCQASACSRTCTYMPL